MSVPRTSPDSVLFTTYNVLDLFAADSPGGREHYDQVVASIRALDTDILAIQELRAPNEDMARQRLLRLAGDVGMECEAPGQGQSFPALGLGARGYHLGLLWRPGITPVAGSFRSRRQDLWHALAWVTLDTGGRAVRHAVHHATPFGRKIRADQCELVVAALARPTGGVPTLVGADWNSESADRVRDEASGEWRLYEPRDPYAGADWFGDMIYQCEWDYDERGQRRHRADRSAGEVLFAGGLHDAAAVLRAPWQATAGHHPDDPYGAHGVRRRIDQVRVTRHLLGALRAHHVTDNALTRCASDHLPVTVEYDPRAIDLSPARA